MAKQKKEQIQARTPAGVAAYCWVYKPDTGHKYSDNKHKVTIVLDGDTDMSDIEAKAEAAAKAEWGNIPDDLKMPWIDGDTKKDKEEFAGKILLTAKSKFPPTVVGPDRKPLPDGVEVRSGDLVKASFVLYAYEKTEKVKDAKTKKVTEETMYGISAQLRGIQLLEKRNIGGDASNDFDDESEEYETPKGKGGEETEAEETGDTGGDGDY